MTTLRDVVIANSLFTKTRLYSLYSDFRKLKEVNPEGYEANLIAWKSLIDQIFQSLILKHTFVLETDGLLEELTLPEYGKPMALDFVLDELIKTSDLIPYSYYIAEKNSIYTTKWVRPALSWVVNRFLIDTSYKIGAKNNSLKSQQLIYKKLLESYTEKLLKVTSKEGSNSKTVFTKDQLKQYINTLDLKIGNKKAILSDLDYEILLKYLERDVKKIQTDEEYIKFGDSEITEEDKAIAHIKATLEEINLKNDELSAKINNVTLKLKQSLQSNNKELSKNLLKSKKIAENSLNKQLVSLNQLEAILFKIDESSTNLQLISALEKGSTVLKSLNSQFGGIERVEQLMDELEEQSAQSTEITEELTRLGSGINNDEIEEEFEQMLRESEAKHEVNNESTEEISDKLNKLKITPSAIISDEVQKSEVQKEGVLN